MNWLGSLSSKFIRRWNHLDPTSLQFRLVLSVLVIYGFELISVMALSHWEMKSMLSTMPPDYPTYNKFLTSASRLLTLNLVATTVMMVAIAGLIIRSLRPLQRFSHWATSPMGGVNLSPLNRNPAPSEIRALVQAWNTMYTKLTEVQQQQRQFTNDVAHELRSPLSLVYGYLQSTLKRSQNLTDAQQEALVMATAEAERMTLILQDLLDLARADNIEAPWLQEPLTLNEFVREIAGMTEKFEHRSIQTEIAPFPIRVRTNRDHLMQVLNHLIQNAVRYSDRGESVVVRLTHLNNTAVIQVSDRGCGIPESQQALVFEPFYRVDPSRARSTGGTGLGLAIVKSLVKQMGGDITLDSHPGEGSTFTLTLPMLGA